MKYNPETPEQEMTLKDGRKIYKTHNGFRCWLVDQKGNHHQVDQNYYSNAKKHAI